MKTPLTYDQSVQILDVLAPMYVNWINIQGIYRACAEEVLLRDGLTEYQTKWLNAFVTL